MPERPGGSPWRPQHLRAAQLRATGATWKDVAEDVGFAHTTVMKYSSLDGFGELVIWFEYKALELRRETWLKNEESLIFEGVEAMHRSLIDIMSNTPAERKYEEILKDSNGDPVLAADTGQPVLVERTGYEYPSAYVRTYAAQTYAKIIGYEEAKRLLAQRAIKPEPSPLDELEHEGVLDAEFVDASIDYGDYDDEEP